MATPFQAAALVACPSYPNSIAWSDENLVAIASGHLITILNPALLDGPRGVITLPPIKPHPIGVVSREDLMMGCLLPTCLSRDTRPCARSISWSHLGMAPNSGCLLAVCTTEGRVKLYRQPFSEFNAEWVQVIDISDLLFDHLVCTDIEEADMPSIEVSCEQATEYRRESRRASDSRYSISNKRQKLGMAHISHKTGALEDQVSYIEKNTDAKNSSSPPNGKRIIASTERATFPCLFKKNTSVEVLNNNGTQLVWVRGMIKRINGGKALIRYPETVTNGKEDEWVELNLKCDKRKGSNAQDSIKTDHSGPPPKVRPCMDLGNLPEQIFRLEFHNLEAVLSNGQAVEAWLDDRWVEGIYMSSNEHGMQVKLSGVNESVVLDSKSVRLAPLWDCRLNSWQVTLLKIEEEDLETADIVQLKSERSRKNSGRNCSSQQKSKKNVHSKQGEKGSSTQTAARQYASRNAMLSSTVVAWSPVLDLSSSERDCSNMNILPRYFSLLSVGGKSGKISFWRISEPQRYSIVPDSGSVDVMLAGQLQAHKGWITAICWEMFSICGSTPQVVLVTGSSDGSVKIWLVNHEGLINSSKFNSSSFCLLKEVTSCSAPVSVLSLAANRESPDNLLLAIGRGSGSLELCIYDLSSCGVQISGPYDAHIQVVTGLTWAFGGCCLYSCSQDDSVCCWTLRDNTLEEVAIPSTSLGIPSSADLPSVSDSCFGLAVSPGNLVFAVVRCFDPEFLDPMYQARTQKAAIEFIWIGGQELGSFPGSPEGEMKYWKSNILWSLNKYEHLDKPLVVWDVIAALFTIHDSAKSSLRRVLAKWLPSLFGDGGSGSSIEEILVHASQSIRKIPSRKLHLLNIICRRFSGVLVKDEQINTLTALLNISENELRERLVAFNFELVLSLASSSPVGGEFLPVGIAQMQKWVTTNKGRVHEQLQLLASNIKKLGKRLHSICNYVEQEKCRFCSASVTFESPEDGSCGGERCKNGVRQRHKLLRCSVSMQICPTTTPLWYCICCKRSASELVPRCLFKISHLPFNLKSLIGSSSQVTPKPLCPFCGIVLQRLQPEFLLSVSPV